MSEEPGTQQPEQPTPFAERPQDPAALRGCSRPALYGCGAILILLALGMLLLVSKSRDLFLWSMDQNAERILTRLPADVTDEEEERLRRAFDGASAAVLEGRVDLNRLRDILQVADLAAQPNLDRQDVLAAIEALERAAASSGPGGSASRESPARLPRAA